MLFSFASRPSCVSSCATSQVISIDSRVAASVRVDKRPGRGSRARSGKRLLALAVLFLSALVGFAPSAEAQTAHFSWAISTVGSGFRSPTGVAVDSSGNVFVADNSNNAVKEILAAGGYTTVNTLGSGFSYPISVAVDGSGNVFVGDAGNNAVKEILAAGGYTTVNTLGSGFSNPSGVAVDRSGNVFVADNGNHAVKEIPAGGGPITTLGSGFSSPTGVAVDGSGNVFVADYLNNAVKEILAGSYTTVNTLGSGFYRPEGVAVDGSGNVFVADYGHNAVKEIVAAGGYLTVNTLGSGFNSPSGVAVDGSGNVFVADFGNNAVKEIITQGVNFGSAAIGTGTPLNMPLTFTFDTAGTITAPAVLTQGTTGLDFADAGTGTCTTNGTTHTYAAGDTCTVNLTFVPQLPGARNGAVVLTNASGNAIATAYVYGTGLGPQVTFDPGTVSVVNTGGVSLNNPFQLALDGASNMYVSNYTGQNVMKIAAGGGIASVLSLGTPGGIALQHIAGVAVDGAGNLFIGDHENSRILVMTPGGAVSILSINGLSLSLGYPTALAFDGYGNLYIADFTNGRIVEVSSLVVAGSTSSGVGTVIGTGSYSFAVSTLTGLAVDSQRTIYAAARTQNNSSIVKITAAGIASLVNTGGLTLDHPQGVFADGTGNLYIEDAGNSRIVKVSPAGIATVVSIAGLTNPSTLGLLNFGVTVDPSGNLYILDWNNNRIVEVNTATPPSLSFAQTNVGSTSAAQMVTLWNNGNANLSFPIPASGNNPSISADFQLNSTSSGTCPLTGSTSSTPGVLAAGVSCTLPISFAPTATGNISGSLVTTDDHLNATAPTYATQSIALSGTGTPGTPTIIFAVANHAFGDAPFTVSATSTSTGAFTYAVVSGPATISGSMVTLTGVGTVVLSASQAASGNYVTATATTSFTVTAAPPVVPTLSFASIGAQIYGTAPFQVSATSASNGSVTYAVVSGPATISGSTVTLTGVGTVVLSASQAASGNYAAATATTNFTVAAGFALTSGTGSTSGTATVAPGAAATFTLTLSPRGSATYPDAVTFTASGLPSGATATFSPSTIPAGGAATSVTLTIQTSNSQTAHNEKLFSGGPLAPVALGFLLLPLAGMKSVRRRLRQMPRLTAALAIMILSLGSLLGLSGCGGSNSPSATAGTYTVAVTATDVTTGAHSSVNVTLNVQ
jgi:sugar lactone lactonase YvrE